METGNMECLKGKSVYKGIALGKISVLKKNDYVVKRTKADDVEGEIGSGKRTCLCPVTEII